MGRHQDEVRERMNRDADIMRGVGGMVGLDDMSAYLDELNYAALDDARERERELIAAEEAEMGIDYDDRDYCDKERGT